VTKEPHPNPSPEGEGTRRGVIKFYVSIFLNWLAQKEILTI
jgi:hypothetical protein